MKNGGYGTARPNNLNIQIISIVFGFTRLAFLFAFLAISSVKEPTDWHFQLSYALITAVFIYFCLLVTTRLIHDKPKHVLEHKQKTETILEAKRNEIREQKRREGTFQLKFLIFWYHTVNRTTREVDFWSRRLFEGVNSHVILNLVQIVISNLDQNCRFKLWKSGPKSHFDTWSSFSNKKEFSSPKWNFWFRSRVKNFWLKMRFWFAFQ